MIPILEIGLTELLDAARLDADGTEINHFVIVQDCHRTFLSICDKFESQANNILQNIRTQSYNLSTLLMHAKYIIAAYKIFI